MMAAVCHYIDKSHKKRTRLIALRRLRGSHSGENIDKHLAEIVQEFGIDDRLATLSRTTPTQMMSQSIIFLGP
jgi:hypothetical protein